MAVTIARTAWQDDDGTGTTGTVINNAVKTSLYDQIDGAIAQLLPANGGTVGGTVILSAGGISTPALTVTGSAIFGTAATPVGKLDVVGVIDATSAIAMRFAGTFSGSGIGAYFTDAATYNTFVGTNGFGDFQVITGRFPGVAGTARLTVKTAGTIQFNTYGAGNLSTDASGNVAASDGRLKDTQGPLTYGLAEVLALEPIVYRWKPNSGCETAGTYAGFDARAMAATMPLAAPYNPQTDLHNIDDRALLGAIVDAIRELAAR